MMDKCDVSDEMLNAFADGELDAADRARLLNLVSGNDDLRGRVCQLWQLKEMVRSAYPAAVVPPRQLSAFQRYRHALAAGVMLVFGLLAGWVAHDGYDSLLPFGFQLYAKRADEGKVILQVSSSAPDRLKAALDQADQLAQSRDRLGRPMQVELVANGDALALVRADANPYVARIAAMHKAHGNLKFIACDNAIEFLRVSGEKFTLLPDVVVAPSALDQIMLRLQQGWTYVQI